MTEEAGRTERARGAIHATVVLPPDRHAPGDAKPVGERLQRSLLSVVVTAIGVMFLRSSDLGSRMAAFVLILGGLLLFLASGAWRRGRPQTTKTITGELSASSDGLELRGESDTVTVERSRMTHADAAPVDGGAIVHIARKGAPPIRVSVDTLMDAKRIVRRLDLGPSRRASRFSAVGPFLGPRDLGTGPLVGIFVAVALIIALMPARHSSTSFLSPYLAPYVSHANAWSGLLAFALTAGLVGFFAAPTRIDVRSDGVATRWLWKRRFIRFADVTDVHAFDTGESMGKDRRVGVELVLAKGEAVRFHLAPEALAPTYARIDEAFHRYRHSGDEAVSAAPLERRGRAPADWVAALHAIGSGANADMRTAPLPEKHLLRIVEDPALAPAVRASAAVALSKQLSPRMRERVRIATDDGPRALRDAVARACNGADDEALAEALAAVESEPEKTRV